MVALNASGGESSCVVAFKEMMNKLSFWWLIGAAILCVGASVVTSELRTIQTTLTPIVMVTPITPERVDSKSSEPEEDDVVDSEVAEQIRMAREYSSPTKKRLQKHRVQHKEMLNKMSFWWLMGAAVLCVGALVVTSELRTIQTNLAPVPMERVDSKSSKPTEATPPSLPKLGLRVHCFFGLNVSLLLNGISQEFIMTHMYSSDTEHDGTSQSEKIPSALFLVLCNRLVAMIFAMFVVWGHGRFCSSQLLWSGSRAAVSHSLAQWCQHQCLAYVPFTLQATVHNVRLLLVQVLDSLRGEDHALVDYAETLAIMCSVCVFGLETRRSGDLTETSLPGMFLLLGMVVFDAVTPHLQEMVFAAHAELTAMQGMLVMSATAAILIVLVQLVNGMLFVSLAFLAQHPDAIVHLSVLAVSSTLAQYYIVYTIKNLGPLFFALVMCTRQVIAVCASALLFQHHISELAGIAVAIIVGVLMLKALRFMLLGTTSNRASCRGRLTTLIPFLICAASIHVIHCFYAILQEFLSVHTFKGELFAFPAFTVLLNHGCGSILAWMTLRFKGLPACQRDMRLTLLPAFSNFVGAFCQHKALYLISFPTQTVLKTLKIIPVMLIGRLLKNRRYSAMDYADSGLITILVAFFVWDFQMASGGSNSDEDSHKAARGIVLMMGYLIADAFTSNLQDHVYQLVQLDPAQMFFGMEAISSCVALTTLICNGQFIEILGFVAAHPKCMLYLSLLGISAACGSYACTTTVHLFGPAVFALLMVSRQVMSLVLSVSVFGHEVDFVQCLCLITVSLIILTSSVRRVGAQFMTLEKSMSERLPSNLQQQRTS